MNGDVGQVDESVVRIFWVYVEFVGTRPKVAFLAKVNVTVRVYRHPNPNVELPLFD